MRCAQCSLTTTSLGVGRPFCSRLVRSNRYSLPDGSQGWPYPSLSPGWLDATNDGSAEWRLACALGSAAADYRASLPFDRVRHHWLPLDDTARRFLIREKRLAKDPRVVASGRDPIRDLILLVSRRLVEASQEGARRLPLVAAPGFGAIPSDLSLLVSGQLDVRRVLALARAVHGSPLGSHVSSPDIGGQFIWHRLARRSVDGGTASVPTMATEQQPKYPR